MTPEIPNTNCIEMYLHCKLCLREKPPGVSPESFQSGHLAIGYTKQGIQVWCKRHDCNIIHIDFAGQKFDANTTLRLGVRED
jgi:hypothetical protein